MKISKVESQEGKEFNEQLNDSKFKKMNLFFIKSKHAFRQFKNHDYFEDHKKSISCQQGTPARQFVDFPAPYGISNAYDYICEEISKNYLRKHKTTQKKFRTIHERYNEDENRTSQTCIENKRKTHFTLPNLGESKKEQKMQQIKMFKQQSEIRERVDNQTNITKPLVEGKSDIQKKKGECLINLVYIDGSSPSKMHSFQLKLNIHNYIISTFLKTKIHYSQLSEEQFAFILTKILQIYQMQREHMEYKNLVNFKSTREIFEIIESYKGKEIETRETFRYFFVAKEQVYQYQFNRIKDELKDRLRFQFQHSPKKMEIFMYDALTGVQITNLYELIKYNKGKLIFGIHENILPLYKRYIEEENTKKHLVNRINKWKSIISDKTMTEMSFKPISAQKYKFLFENAQKKRVNFNRNKKKCDISLKNSQFINRESLFKDQNIFQ